MRKIILLGLVALGSFGPIACEHKTTVIREREVAPPAPAEDSGVKIKVNDGSGSGVDVNIPTKN
ncbi:MAG: hypothetical protein Q7S68_05045 [Deltaproteobacteria bacterium]|nr:hypothetical protein [Deltaproteobacteria bacterium]